MHRNRKLLGKLNGTNLQHLSPGAGQLDHFVIRNTSQFLRILTDPWVGGENTLDVGVDLTAAALRNAANATALVSDPPRPRVVILSSSSTPWKPAITTTSPACSDCIIFVESMFLMRALP